MGNEKKTDDAGRDVRRTEEKEPGDAGKQERQIDDNQDDMGRDVNKPSKASNAINARS